MLGVLSALLLSSACTFGGSPLVQPESTVSVPVIAATPTLAIRETPTSLPAMAILVAPADDPTGAELDPVLSGLSAEGGLRFEHLQEIPSDLDGERINVAVIVGQMDDLTALTQSWPRVQFIAVGVTGLSSSANLTVVEPLTERTDDVGFLGGYMAALVSEDWRVASLSQPESTTGATTRIAFANGAEFLCGLCRPVFPPYPGFPLDYPTPTQGDPQAPQTTLAQIEQDRVEVIFLQPGLSDPDIVNGLTGMGVQLIGVGSPDPGQSAAWIATIDGDPAEAVRSVWSSALGGESGGTVRLPLRVSVYDPTKLTPGRLLQLQTMMDDLDRGYIDTGVDPLTGNPK